MLYSFQTTSPGQQFLNHSGWLICIFVDVIPDILNRTLRWGLGLCMRIIITINNSNNNKNTNTSKVLLVISQVGNVKCSLCQVLSSSSGKDALCWRMFSLGKRAAALGTGCHSAPAKFFLWDALRNSGAASSAPLKLRLPNPLCLLQESWMNTF